MDDTPTTLLVAERDENTRAFLLDNLAADGYEPLGAQTEQETRLKLRAATDSAPGGSASPAGNRELLARWRRAGRFEQDTVAALADLLFGEGRLKRLDDPQVGELAHCLEFAVRGRVAPRALAGAITRLSKRDDREEAAKALRAWLIEKANERELLGRRRAA
jgi:hypothetical protein